MFLRMFAVTIPARRENSLPRRCIMEDLGLSRPKFYCKPVRPSRCWESFGVAEDGPGMLPATAHFLEGIALRRGSEVEAFAIVGLRWNGYVGCSTGGVWTLAKGRNVGSEAVHHGCHDRLGMCVTRLV